MVKNNDLQKLKPIIIRVLRKRGITKAGVFGSYARGDQKKNSDIDILIKPTSNMGFAFAGVKLDLERKLKKKVDLLSYNGLHHGLKNRILREEVRIL